MKVWEKNLELNNLCPECRDSLTCYLTSNCLPTLSAGYSIGASGFKNNEFVINDSKFSVNNFTDAKFVYDKVIYTESNSNVRFEGIQAQKGSE